MPQEQYEALMAKFAAVDLTVHKHEEAVEYYRKEIKKRDDQLGEMEIHFNARMRDEERKITRLHEDARDSMRQHEADLRAKDEAFNAKSMEDAILIASVQEEVAAARKERDSLYSEKMKVEEIVDQKEATIA